MHLMNRLEKRFGSKSGGEKCLAPDAGQEMKGTKIDELEKRLSLLK